MVWQGSRRVWLGQFTSTCAAAMTAPSTFDHSSTPIPKRQFQLGIVTYNLASQWDLPTLMRIAGKTGIAAVELRTTHAHGVEPTLTAKERTDIRRRFQDSGVRLWGLGTVCEFQSSEPNVVRQNLDVCNQFLELSADLGGVGVKVRPNGLPKGIPTDVTLKQIGESLSRCGEAAKKLQQEVWLEVHGAGTADPKHIQTIMEHCRHPNAGVTWNSNSTDIVNGSLQESMQRLQPYIKSCHINELYGRYPYRELFTALRRMQYDRFTLIEIPQKLNPEAGELLIRYYKSLWQELADRA